MNLDSYIRIEDIAGFASKEAISRKRFRKSYPPSAFPSNAYDALRSFLHFEDGSSGREVEYDKIFEKIMGFSIYDLIARAKQLEAEANSE